MPVEVSTYDTADRVLRAGVTKLQQHDCNFLVVCPPPHDLFYPDGSKVEELPEGGEFTVLAYKNSVGKEYARITLYVGSSERKYS